MSLQEFNQLSTEYRNISLRSLFDCYCSEWDNQTISSKLAMLRGFANEGWSVGRLVEVFREIYNDNYRPDIAGAVPFALNKLCMQAVEELDEQLANEIYKIIATCDNHKMVLPKTGLRPHIERTRGKNHLRM